MEEIIHGETFSTSWFEKLTAFNKDHASMCQWQLHFIVIRYQCILTGVFTFAAQYGETTKCDFLKHLLQSLRPAPTEDIFK